MLGLSWGELDPRKQPPQGCCSPSVCSRSWAGDTGVAHSARCHSDPWFCPSSGLHPEPVPGGHGNPGQVLPCCNPRDKGDPLPACSKHRDPLLLATVKFGLDFCSHRTGSQVSTAPVRCRGAEVQAELTRQSWPGVWGMCWAPQGSCLAVFCPRGVASGNSHDLVVRLSPGPPRSYKPHAVIRGRPLRHELLGYNKQHQAQQCKSQVNAWGGTEQRAPAWSTTGSSSLEQPVALL